MTMYVWTIGLEVQYKSTWKENKKEKFSFWEDSGVEYTVAASTGFEAIEKAKEVFMSKEPWEGERDISVNEEEIFVPTTEHPHKVLDIVSLELKETLDG